MDLVQLVYASQPFGYDESILYGILSKSRRNNARDDITGALICRADIFLQLLEGPKPAIDATFARIARDDRHLEIRRLLQRPVEERMFPGWAMMDDPARSWMWPKEEIDAGVLSRTTPDEVVALFSRLATEAGPTPAHPA